MVVKKYRPYHDKSRCLLQNSDYWLFIFEDPLTHSLLQTKQIIWYQWETLNILPEH